MLGEVLKIYIYVYLILHHLNSLLGSTTNERISANINHSEIVLLIHRTLNERQTFLDDINKSNAREKNFFHPLAKQMKVNIYCFT